MCEILNWQWKTSYKIERQSFCFQLYYSGDMHVWVLSLFSCVRLLVTLWTVAHQAPQSSPSSRGSSRPKDWTHISRISCIACVFFTAKPSGRRAACKRLLINTVQLLIYLLFTGYPLCSGHCTLNRWDKWTVKYFFVLYTKRAENF